MGRAGRAAKRLRIASGTMIAPRDQVRSRAPSLKLGFRVRGGLGPGGARYPSGLGVRRPVASLDENSLMRASQSTYEPAGDSRGFDCFAALRLAALRPNQEGGLEG
jgi:hypothetical protein